MQEKAHATRPSAATTARSDRVVEVAYDGTAGIEVVVPHGTTLADLAKVWPRLVEDLAGRLPRGCTGCQSGDNLIIRERFEHVLRVDLDEMAGPGQ
jgi:hypothetical protein